MHKHIVDSAKRKTEKVEIRKGQLKGKMMRRRESARDRRVRATKKGWKQNKKQISI